jgi:hypothetical protein
LPSALRGHQPRVDIDVVVLHVEQLAAADQEPVGNFSVKSLGNIARRDHKGMVRVS